MTIGILGGGQLARMLALAAHPLGLRTLVLDPKADCPASAVCEHLRADYEDSAALDVLAERCSVVTYEFENVPVAAVERLAQSLPVRPGANALRVSSDRVLEKQTLNELGIRTAPFRAVDDRAGLEDAVGALGLPAILKTRRLGYDGKGQWLLRDAADVDAVPARGGLILEGFVPFGRELSVVGVRGLNGSFVSYPLAENTHRQGVLLASRAPALVAPEVEQAARDHARALADHLDYVGVFAVELFDTDQGLVANEIAPRVHNSGHWTIEGAETSQFENHIRAVAGLPLGSTAPRGESLMRNCLGSIPSIAEVAAIPGAHLHDYAKAARPGRKVGHITLTAPDATVLEARAAQLAKVL